MLAELKLNCIELLRDINDIYPLHSIARLENLAAFRTSLARAPVGVSPRCPTSSLARRLVNGAS